MFSVHMLHLNKKEFSPNLILPKGTGDRTKDYRHFVLFSTPDNPALCIYIGVCQDIADNPSPVDSKKGTRPWLP